MVKVKYGQIRGIQEVLGSWRNATGLSIPFQRRVMAVSKALAKNAEEFDELREKFVQEYAARNEDGQVKTEKKKIGVTADGQDVEDEVYVFNDPQAADEQFKALVQSEFDCPTLDEASIDTYAEKLGITLARFAVIEDIIQPESNA